MKFQVPQFIEVEDKIFGPFTLKQFIYIAGGAGLSLVFFVFIPWWYVSIIPIGATLGISLGLAFYKINNKPLVYIIEAGMKYYLNPKLYVWKKEESTPTISAGIATPTNMPTTQYIPNTSGSKLKDMNWNLTVKKDMNETVEVNKTGERM